MDSLQAKLSALGIDVRGMLVQSIAIDYSGEGIMMVHISGCCLDTRLMAQPCRDLEELHTAVDPVDTLAADIATEIMAGTEEGEG